MGLGSRLRIGTISYMFPTSELRSNAKRCTMLQQQCGAICHRKSRILRFHSKHTGLKKYFYNQSVDCVNDMHLRFAVITTTTEDAL